MSANMSSSVSLPHHAHALQPYYSVIDEALSSRSTEDFRPCPEKGGFLYEVRMAERLVAALKERGAESVSLPDVMALVTQASGHSDYHRSLAIACRALERNGAAVKHP